MVYDIRQHGRWSYSVFVYVSREDIVVADKTYIYNSGHNMVSDMCVQE